MSLIYQENIKNNVTDFVNKVIDVSNQLGIDPNWLMAVMNFESNLNPQARNNATGATGLIQFIPSTAASLGTTTQDLMNMSNVDQLDYVLQYYNQYKSKITKYVDLYLATLFPAALGKPDNYVLQTDTLSASKIASENPVFDLNKNNQITVGEIAQQKLDSIPSDWRNVFTASKDSIVKFGERNWLAISLCVVALIGVVFLLVENKNNIIKNLN